MTKHPIGILAGWFYRDPRLSALTVLLALAAGVSSLWVLPRMEDPQLTQRAGNIVTVFPGADAQRVEALVTEKLEERLRELPEIKRLRSQSRAGASFISVELRDDIYDPGPAWSKVRGKIEDAIGKLPEGATRPEFTEAEISAYAWVVGIVWNRQEPPSYGVMRRLARELRDQLLAVPGTKKVDLFGDPTEEILVELDVADLAAAGVSPAQVAMRLANADVKSASGFLRSGASDTIVQFRNEFQSLEDIAKATVESSVPGSLLQLEEIANIRRGTPDPPAALALVDSQPAIVVSALLRSNFRIDQWNDLATPVIEAFSSSLPEGVELQLVMTQDRYVNDRMNSLLSNLSIAVIAVAGMTFVFLGWRSSLLVTLTLPLTAMIVLAGMRALGIPIHQMSVTGMIIAMGLLIDNAIIAADEVTIGLQRGLSPMEAASDMVARLFGPLLASTATTALAFAPIALMEGPAGEFVGTIAITVMLAIFGSLALSMTMLPATAAWLLGRTVKSNSVASEEALAAQDASANSARSKRKWLATLYAFWSKTLDHGVSFSWMTKRYERFLAWIFRRPWLGVGLGMALPVLGFVAATQLSEQFFPPADRDQFYVELEMEPRSSISQTRETVLELDRLFRENERVQNTSWFLGESAPSFYYNLIARRRNVPSYAQGIVKIDSNLKTGELIRQLQRECDRRFPHARVLVRQLEQGPPFEAPVEVRIFGPDLNRLHEIGEQLRQIATTLPTVTHTKTGLSENRPMAEIQVDQGQASWAGISEKDVADQLFSRLEGLYAGTILEQVEQIPVRVRLSGDRRDGLMALQEMALVGGRASDLSLGGSATSTSAKPTTRLTSLVPISNVTEIELAPQRALINHFNGRRMNELQAFILAETLPSRALQDLQTAMQSAGFELPLGYRLEFGGEASERNDAVSRLMANVSVLAICMLGALVLALGSFRLTGLIGFVAFLSAGLGMGALWCFGYPFGFMAIIGTMGLIGIAINDSIVVVAALKENAAAKSGNVDAMVHTVMEVTRHVLATTFTTVIGFMPLILGGGAFWPPLAVAIGAGVLGASIIALTLVPCTMKLIFRMRNAPAPL